MNSNAFDTLKKVYEINLKNSSELVDLCINNHDIDTGLKALGNLLENHDKLDKLNEGINYEKNKDKNRKQDRKKEGCRKA